MPDYSNYDFWIENDRISIEKALKNSSDGSFCCRRARDGSYCLSFKNNTSKHTNRLSVIISNNLSISFKSRTERR